MFVTALRENMQYMNREICTHTDKKAQWKYKDREYDFIHIADGVFSPIYDVIAQDVIRQTGSLSGTLLDIGCGGGHLGRAIMKRTGHSGCFLDIDERAVSLARERAIADGLESVLLLSAWMWSIWNCLTDMPI